MTLTQPTYQRRAETVVASPIRPLVAAAAHDWQALPKWVADAYEDGLIIFLPDGISLTRKAVPDSVRNRWGLDDVLVAGPIGDDGRRWLAGYTAPVFAATFEEAS